MTNVALLPQFDKLPGIKEASGKFPQLLHLKYGLNYLVAAGMDNCGMVSLFKPTLNWPYAPSDNEQTGRLYYDMQDRYYNDLVKDMSAVILSWIANNLRKSQFVFSDQINSAHGSKVNWTKILEYLPGAVTFCPVVENLGQAGHFIQTFIWTPPWARVLSLGALTETDGVLFENDQGVSSLPTLLKTKTGAKKK